MWQIGLIHPMCSIGQDTSKMSQNPVFVFYGKNEKQKKDIYINNYDAQ